MLFLAIGQFGRLNFKLLPGLWCFDPCQEDIHDTLKIILETTALNMGTDEAKRFAFAFRNTYAA